jgi:TctA family transporter
VEERLKALAEAAAGAAAGAASAVVPGLHVNSLAAALPDAPSAFLVAAFAASGFAALAAAVFLGAPDEASAAGALPAHALLLEGRGHEAARRLAAAAFVGFALSLALLPAWRLALGTREAVDALDAATPWLLAALLATLLLTERRSVAYRRAWRVAPLAPEARISGHARRRDGSLVVMEDGRLVVDDIGWIEGDDLVDVPVARARAHGRLSRALGALLALAAFLVAGALGVLALDTGISSPLGLPGATPLLPLLGGLFGAPALLLALRRREGLPPQVLCRRVPMPRLREVAPGALAGSLVGLLPSLSAGHAAAVAALLARGGNERESALDATGAAAGGAAGASLAAWLVLHRARSGALAAADDPEPWMPLWPPPPDVPEALAAALVGATLGYAAAALVAEALARGARFASGRAAPAFALALLTAGTWAFAGGPGLLLLVAAAAVGLLPVRWRVRRLHCMGSLAVPVLARALFGG